MRLGTSPPFPRQLSEKKPTNSQAGYATARARADVRVMPPGGDAPAGTLPMRWRRRRRRRGRRGYARGDYDSGGGSAVAGADVMVDIGILIEAQHDHVRTLFQ